jgi:hypothetical protein
MVDLEKAIEFVRAGGNAIENARLDSIVFGAKASQAILSELQDMQKSDGGFSYWLPDRSVSTVCDTAYILGWMDDMSIRSGAVTEKAIQFIFRYLKEDGGWDEVPYLKTLDPPEFLMPGETKTRVWLTAYCAHYLMLFGYEDSFQRKGSPVEFLLAHQEPSGRLSGYQRATWDALPILARFPVKGTAPFELALGFVESDIKPEEWAGSYLAWLLRGLRDSHLSADHPLVARCLRVLSAKQREDGGWDAEDAKVYDVSATIEVIRVLKDFGFI